MNFLSQFLCDVFHANKFAPARHWKLVCCKRAHDCAPLQKRIAGNLAPIIGRSMLRPYKSLRVSVVRISVNESYKRDIIEIKEPCFPGSLPPSHIALLDIS